LAGCFLALQGIREKIASAAALVSSVEFESESEVEDEDPL
jgi:hypothetical protein